MSSSVSDRSERSGNPPLFDRKSGTPPEIPTGAGGTRENGRRFASRSEDQEGRSFPLTPSEARSQPTGRRPASQDRVAVPAPPALKRTSKPSGQSERKRVVHLELLLPQYTSFWRHPVKRTFCNQQGWSFDCTQYGRKVTCLKCLKRMVRKGVSPTENPGFVPLRYLLR